MVVVRLIFDLQRFRPRFCTFIPMFLTILERVASSKPIGPYGHKGLFAGVFDCIVLMVAMVLSVVLPHAELWLVLWFGAALMVMGQCRSTVVVRLVPLLLF